MANLSAALHLVRRARQQVNAPASGRFEEYRPEYAEILRATEALAGEDAFEELKEWMVEATTERNRLPTPDEVRRRARRLCADSDVRVPDDSPLRE